MRPFFIALFLCAQTSLAAAGQIEDAALALINAQRATAGCGPLRPSAALHDAAAGHANAMAQKDFFSHTGKNGSNLKSRVQAVGYRWSALAENIAAGQPSAKAAVKEWLGSAGHRKNMLNCTYTETGLALAYQPDDAPLPGHSHPFKYYWVQVFGRP